MQRARLWTLSVLVLGFVLLGIGGVGPVSLRLVRPAAAVAWPVSTAALLAEVVTGGASASDEFVEITNAAAASIDLQNVELIYISSAGTSPDAPSAATSSSWTSADASWSARRSTIPSGPMWKTACPWTICSNGRATG